MGQTDVWVSPMGLGTVKFGRNEAVKYPGQFNIPDNHQVRQLLDLARSLGINLLDTAPAYGCSEERLGELLKSERKNWVICTKVGEEFNQGESCFNFYPEHIQLSIERSLKRLQTDWLDIVLVHSDGNDVDIIEKYAVFSVLNDLKQRGLIKAYGMSTKTFEGGLLALEQSDVVMTTCEESSSDKQVLDRANVLNKGILIKKAFASGHAVNVPDAAHLVENRLDAIFSYPAVSSVIIGSINPKHLTQNISALHKVLRPLQ